MPHIVVVVSYQSELLPVQPIDTEGEPCTFLQGSSHPAKPTSLTLRVWDLFTSWATCKNPHCNKDGSLKSQPAAQLFRVFGHFMNTHHHQKHTAVPLTGDRAHMINSSCNSQTSPQKQNWMSIHVFRDRGVWLDYWILCQTMIGSWEISNLPPKRPWRFRKASESFSLALSAGQRQNSHHYVTRPAAGKMRTEGNQLPQQQEKAH